jgi:hypothetical protein
MKNIILVLLALISMVLFVLIPFYFKDWELTPSDAALLWFMSACCMTAAAILLCVEQNRSLR